MLLNWLLSLILIFVTFEITCSATYAIIEEINKTTTTNPRLAQARNYADNLFDTLTRKNKYDKKKPSHTPVIFYSYMVLDNLREFNEIDMTMRLQATFILNWRDTRLIWEPKDYGNLTKLSLTSYKIQRFWIPQIIIKSIMPSKTTIIQSINTEFLITFSGNIFAASKLSTLITCDTQMENYPYDRPNCSLYAVCGEQGVERNSVLFGNTNYVTSQNVFFHGNNVTQNKQFEILNFTSQRYYITTAGLRPQNSEEANYVESPGEAKPSKKITTQGSVLHYQIYFKRNLITYSSTVLLPLYIGTLLMVIAADADNITTTLTLMILTIFFQYWTMTRISFTLPPNYLVTPFCMKYAAIIFMETIVLFIFRLAHGYLLQTYETDPKMIQKLRLVKRYFRIFLLLQLLYCTFLLLFV